MNANDKEQIFDAIKKVPTILEIIEHCEDLAFFQCKIDLSGTIGGDLGIIHGLCINKEIYFSIFIASDISFYTLIAKTKKYDRIVAYKEKRCENLQEFKEFIREDILNLLK